MKVIACCNGYHVTQEDGDNVKVVRAVKKLCDWWYRWEGVIVFLAIVTIIITFMLFFVRESIMPDQVAAHRMDEHEEIALQAAMDAGDDDIAQAISNVYVLCGYESNMFVRVKGIDIDMETGIEYVHMSQRVSKHHSNIGNSIRYDSDGDIMVSPEWVAYRNAMGDNWAI